MTWVGKRKQLVFVVVSATWLLVLLLCNEVWWCGPDYGIQYTYLPVSTSYRSYRGCRSWWRCTWAIYGLNPDYCPGPPIYTRRVFASLYIGLTAPLFVASLILDSGILFLLGLVFEFVEWILAIVVLKLDGTFLTASEFWEETPMGPLTFAVEVIAFLLVSISFALHIKFWVQKFNHVFGIPKDSLILKATGKTPSKPSPSKPNSARPPPPPVPVPPPPVPVPVEMNNTADEDY